MNYKMNNKLIFMKEYLHHPLIYPYKVKIYLESKERKILLARQINGQIREIPENEFENPPPQPPPPNNKYEFVGLIFITISCLGFISKLTSGLSTIL